MVLARAFDSPEPMEICGSKTGSMGDVACAVGLSREWSVIHGRHLYKLLLLPVRETGRSVSFDASEIVAVLEEMPPSPEEASKSSLSFGEDGRIPPFDTVRMASLAFPDRVAA